ncbi:N-6 DNA methylase [Halobellus ruber]|uniref:site-specific DNA-methyltransferase (adenine-specific) n=1 Tax=Halobellus ruber TaxID=2761102 RepID=A0A7J9SJT7_9EURY|nr:N-6 DNA methylase [Halobellus ruber]MBB6646296.1 N-6 DNA methylase [Halobellus ruber]
MSGGPSFGDVLGTDSRCHARYTAAASSELSSNDDLRAAMAAWESLVVESHGDVFGQLDAGVDSLFVDALYVDFVVDRLIDRYERRVGVELRNRSAAENTDVLPFELHTLHAAVERAVPGRPLGEAVDRVDPIHPESVAGLLRELHGSVVSTPLRRLLGSYYTPRGVADVAVGELDVDDAASETVLDPGCGSGVFLAAAVDAKLAALEEDLQPDARVDAITSTVYGIDLDPIAVKMAKLSYLHALRPAIGSSSPDGIEVPVFLADSLGMTREESISFRARTVDLTVDHLVGNPPWLTWGALQESVREAWRETHVDRLNLLPHPGTEAILGHANDDVSVPFVWAWIDRYLDDGGDASFVLKRDIRTGPAGRVLRRGQVGDRPVSVRHVHDFGGLRPFGDDVAVNAAVYTIGADSEPSFPIPMDRWSRSGDAPSFATGGAMRGTLARERVGLVPVDDADPGSSWIGTDAERRAHGECSHEIRHGVKDDAAEVFTVDRAQLGELDHDHVYPYLRSKHVVKYGLFGYDLQLVPMRTAGQDNAAELRAAHPDTYAYLERNRERLESRSSTWLDGGPFYNLFGLGPYTWSAYKVVWCRLGFKPHFAVVSAVEDPDLGEKPVVPGDHCMFVPTDDEYEAHFLCGLLNSAPYQRSIEGMASEGKASLSKAVVSELRLPEYRGTGPERRLAERSMAAHRIVPEYTHLSKRAYNDTEIEELAAIQAEIDDLAGRMLSGGGAGLGGE